MAHLLTEDILEQVFANLGPVGAAKCACVCHTWKRTVYQSRSMWRGFCESTFGFSQGHATADWRSVYAYLTRKAKEPARLLQEDVEVVFADDGGGFLFFKANRVVKHDEHAWCTNTDVNENVDLVVRTRIPTLVSGFALRNPGGDFSAPLHEALVFASYDTIDLDAARIFDGSNGEEWVTHFEGPKKEVRGRFVVEETLRQQARLLESINNPALEPVAPQHQGVVRTALNPNVDPHRVVLHPLAAFRTPPLPLAYTEFQTQRSAPTVARNIHFKLLNSHKTPDMVADNIDVLSLLTYGIPLPELARMAGTEGSETLPIPHYTRTHVLREVEPDVAMLFGG